MKKIKFKNTLLIGATLLALTFTACEKDDKDTGNSNATKSNTKISMTDAPIDNTEVDAVFVTVTEIRLDGKTYDGFKGKKTFDIAAMQNGKSELLFDGDLENRTYSMMEIDLDLKMDDQGNTPGSYIKTKSNSKLMLNSNTSDDSKVTLFIDKDSKVDAGDDNDFIIDLDLRKCIKQESNGDYAFVSNTELKNSLRIMERDEANTLKGKVNAGAFNNYDNVVAYIYAKGKFKMEEETKESGEDKIRFRNAVSSSVLTDSDEYNFHFIEDGQYELHFFGYNDDDKDGKFELKAMLKTSSSGSVETDNIDISGNSNTTLDLSVTGVLDII